jgi:Type I phosphodiesterase / nucleotide pyrophosphatase
MKPNRFAVRLAIVGLAIAVFPMMPAAQPGSRHVVMISIDGLKPARIVEAITEAGLRDRTDIVIVSDHGFLAIEQQLQLNFAFKRAGLIEVNEAGKLLRWDAYFYAAGGSGFVKGPSNPVK